MKDMKSDNERIHLLSKKMKDIIMSQLTNTSLNGDPIQRYPGNINISFSCVEGESLMLALENIALSSGSACNSASLEPSYVLKALGMGPEMAHTSLRIGIGRFTTESEIDYSCKKIIASVNKLREMSPLWELQQSGVEIGKVNWDNSCELNMLLKNK